MNENDKQLIMKLWTGEIKPEELANGFSTNLIENPGYVFELIDQARDKRDSEAMQYISGLFVLFEKEELLDVFNKLITEDWHKEHEDIIGTLQAWKDPSSIKPIVTSVNNNYQHLRDACDIGSYAKKCSWALYSIGTKEAFNAIEELSKSQDEEVKDQMIYRLKRIREHHA